VVHKWKAAVAAIRTKIFPLDTYSQGTTRIGHNENYQYAVHQQLFVGFQSFYDSFKKVINWAAKNCRFNKKLLITPSIAVFYNFLWCILQLCTNPEL
jgi:hypothetical protein